MESQLQRSYPGSKHLYALWEAVMTRRLLHLSMTVRLQACLSSSSKTASQLEELCIGSELRLARTTSVKTLFLCHSHEAPGVVGLRDAQAYRDTPRMGTTSPLPYYSSIA